MIAIPAYAVADARAGAAAAGYPHLWPVVLSIAKFESGFDPRAMKLDSVEQSYGYTQFNRDGGLGTNIPIDELLDGPNNMRLAARYIGDALASGRSLYSSLQPWSVRDSALALLPEIEGGGFEQVAGEPPAAAPGASPVLNAPPLAGTATGRSNVGAIALALGAVAVLLVAAWR